MLARPHRSLRDFTAAVEAAQRILQTLGDVIPVADQPVTLKAVVDGEVVEGQVAVATAHGSISDLQIDPQETMATRKHLPRWHRPIRSSSGPGASIRQ